MNFILRPPNDSLPELLIVPMRKLAESENPFAAISAATNVPTELIRSDFSGELKETHTIYFSERNHGKRIVLLGLGENPGPLDVQNAFRSFVFKRRSNLPAQFGVSLLFGNAPNDATMWIEAAVNGMLLGTYDIGLYKTEDKKKSTLAKAKIEIFADKKLAKAAQQAIDKGQATAETQLSVFDLVNAPANKKPPKVLADWALASGKKHGYKVKVLGKKEITALGLHALLAVNLGSEHPPAFIVMEHKPKGKKKLTKVGLVGKGVTFDTGGLSIKPSNNMHYMKSDMGGAAAVLGTMELAAKLQLPLHLMGVIPATENSVDSLSVKPGDVIGSYAGKSIEVIDTDAEGRLILADGLAYTAKNFKPDVLINLATLTGSCIRTLGTYAGGLFSNNDQLASQLLAAGQRTGERLWQLPLWKDYLKEMRSDVADIKNFSGNPSAGAITAAKFLEAFIQDHPKWAHMDIAGMAIADSEFASQKSATAFGVRLLLSYLETLVHSGPDS